MVMNEHKKRKRGEMPVREWIVRRAREKLQTIATLATDKRNQELAQHEKRLEKERKRAIQVAEEKREAIFQEIERKARGAADAQEASKTEKLEKRLSSWLPPTFDEPRIPEKLPSGDDAWMAKHVNSISAIRDWDREQEEDVHPFAWRAPHIYGHQGKY